MNNNQFDVILKEIENKIIKKIYYFHGENLYIYEILINKILSSLEIKKENSFDFIEINGETFDINKLKYYIKIPPIKTQKKCIIVKNCVMPENDNNFYDDLTDVLYQIPDFCTVIFYDISYNNKKNILYSNFLRKVSKISNFIELKFEESFYIQQSIILSTQYNKSLSPQNAKIICEKCNYDLFLIKNLIKNIASMSNKSNINLIDIEQFLPKYKIDYNIYEISKLIRDKKIKMAVDLFDKIIAVGEDSMRILNIISLDFIDAFKIQKLKNKNLSSHEIASHFNEFKGKEFKINYASKLAENYNVKLILKKLLKADEFAKSSLASTDIILKSAFINIFEYMK